MKRREKIILLAIIFITLFIISLAVTWAIVPKEQNISYNVSVVVGDVMGLNPSRDLNFGTLRPGDSASKKIVFSNMFFSSVRLELSATGNIANFISFEKNATVAPFSSREIPITIAIPDNTTKGGYNGEVIVHAERFL